MRAIAIDENGLAFRPDYQPGTRADGEVPVRVSIAGICETDLQLVKGYMGFRGVLGHEFVGMAVEGKFAGRRVVGEINCVCGDCSFCLKQLGNHCFNRTVIGILNHDGAFAEELFVPERNLHLVPDSLADERAVFVEPLAAAFQIAAQVDLSRHARAVVIGDGRLGYLIAQVLRQHQCQVTVVGKHSPKLKHFSDIGLQTRQLDDRDEERDFNLAVDCTGSITGISTAMRFLRPRGTLVLKTTVSDQHAPSLAQLVIDEITVVGSRCGPFDVALKALTEGWIETDSLITARYRLEQAQQAFVAAASSEHRKVIFEIAT